jgi:RNA polymerase sigma-70 factor (ECF subfamily)
MGICLLMSSPALSPQVDDSYRRYAREMWSVFYGICSDAERATEAVQEAFLRYQRREGLGLRDERAWLLHVGRNWLRDFARRRRNSEQAAGLNEVSTTALDPAGEAVRDELRVQVDQALSRLRSDDREVLLLRYALGWPAPRIAEVLGLRSAAVDMRLTRARQRLALVLNELGVNADSVP